MISRPSRGTAATLLLALCLVVLGLTSLTGQAVGLSATTLPPVTSTTSTTLSTGAPAVGGAAAILVNMDDGRVLYEKKADERRSIASTTKIMTCILALETLPLDHIVTASKHATEVGESEIWLVPGETLSVEDLLYGLLVKSGNDAAMALAEASAGAEEGLRGEDERQGRGAGAEEHPLRESAWTGAQGPLLVGAGHGHPRPIRDAEREFRTLAGTAKTTIPWPGHTYDRTFNNHNTLVGEGAGCTGIKTGIPEKPDAAWSLRPPVRGDPGQSMLGRRPPNATPTY